MPLARRDDLQIGADTVGDVPFLAAHLAATAAALQRGRVDARIGCRVLVECQRDHAGAARHVGQLRRLRIELRQCPPAANRVDDAARNQPARAFLQQARDLDQAEPAAAARLGQAEAEPTEVGDRLPARGVDAARLVLPGT